MLVFITLPQTFYDGTACCNDMCYYENVFHVLYK